MAESYQLIRTRRRTIALIIQNDGSLVVRAPLRAPGKLIREFVESKAGWIRKKQVQARESARVTVKHYLEGEQFWYLGKMYPLLIIPRRHPTLELGSAFRLAKPALPRAEEAFIRWYKAQARQVLAERVEGLAARHGYSFQKMRITSARTRWGSCSAKGTLSFTYRLVMAPPEVIDYVVVHELAHLRIRNHSKVFWRRVWEMMPEYRQGITWLKQNGRLLTLETR